MTDQNGEWIQFGISPMTNVRNISADTITNGSVPVDALDESIQQELLDMADDAKDSVDMGPNVNRLKDPEEIDVMAEEMVQGNGEDISLSEDDREGMDTDMAAETQEFPLGGPGHATRFTIESGSGIVYDILVFRSLAIFGLPQYQVFNPPPPAPCPKQKRIIIVECTLTTFGMGNVDWFLPEFESK